MAAEYERKLEQRVREIIEREESKIIKALEMYYRGFRTEKGMTLESASARAGVDLAHVSDYLFLKSEQGVHLRMPTTRDEALRYLNRLILMRDEKKIVKALELYYTMFETEKSLTFWEAAAVAKVNKVNVIDFMFEKGHQGITLGMPETRENALEYLSTLILMRDEKKLAKALEIYYSRFGTEKSITFHGASALADANDAYVVDYIFQKEGLGMPETRDEALRFLKVLQQYLVQ